MCLILLDWDTREDYLMVVAANRDEFHQRASLAADWWVDHTSVYGGRDLEANGTWMAINRFGHFAAVTNVRKPAHGGIKSRGALAVDFLTHEAPSAGEYIDSLQKTSNDFDGYNFLAFDGATAAWFNNVETKSKTITPNVYGLSNASLDTLWPKVTRIKDGYADISATKDRFKFEQALFALLADEASAKDEHLPDTGVGLTLERQLSPIFIEGDTYGTRCSTIYTLSRSGQARFLERRFDQQKKFLGEVCVEFEIA